MDLNELSHQNNTDLAYAGQPNLGVTTPICSLSGLFDLLRVLEPQLCSLPAPAGLFAAELERCLDEAIGQMGAAS